MLALRTAAKELLGIQPLAIALMGDAVKFSIRTDSQSALLSVRGSKSSALRHCKKAYDISLCWLREQIADILTHIKGPANTADIFTKAFTKPLEWGRVVANVGLRDLPRAKPRVGGA